MCIFYKRFAAVSRSRQYTRYHIETQKSEIDLRETNEEKIGFDQRAEHWLSESVRTTERVACDSELQCEYTHDQQHTDRKTITTFIDATGSNFIKLYFINEYDDQERHVESI